MEEIRILVIADELAVVQSCKRTFTRMGHLVDAVLNPGEAVGQLNVTEYDVVFIDLKLAWGPGRAFVNELKEQHPETALVLMVGRAPVAAALETMSRGSFDFLPKPFDREQLTAALGRALAVRTMLLQALQARRDERSADFGELIGSGPAMRELLRLIERAAPSGTPVFILGEPGTGKQVAAHAIHNLSPRRIEPFVVVEARGHHEEPLAGEIFGRSDEGSGTHNTGKLYAAGAGTLYIDEVASLTVATQGRLLDAIRSRSFTPEGGGPPRTLACRIILATAADLRSAVAEGRFLPELYQETPVFPIYLPPLSERTEDIPALAYNFLRRYCRLYDKKVNSIDERLMTRLIARRWDNNARELAACVEAMVAVCDGEELGIKHYQLVIEEGRTAGGGIKPPSSASELIEVKKLLRRKAVAEVERAFVSSALNRSGGNVTRAAQMVGMQRRNFQTLMRNHGIKAGGGSPNS